MYCTPAFEEENEKDKDEDKVPMSAPPILTRSRSVASITRASDLKRRSTTVGRSRILRPPADREGTLLFRTQHSAPWRSRWCVLRANVVAVYSSEKMSREIAVIRLPPDLLVLPSPIQTSATQSSASSHGPRAIYGFMTLAVQPTAGPRPIPYFFAAESRLDMVQWISHLVRAAKHPYGEERTLIPIPAGPASAPPAVVASSACARTMPMTMPMTTTRAGGGGGGNTGGGASSSSSSSKQQQQSFDSNQDAMILQQLPPVMTQTTASSWPTRNANAPSSVSSSAATTTPRSKRFTFAQLTQRMRGMAAPVKRHTAPADATSSKSGGGGKVVGMGAAVAPQILLPGTCGGGGGGGQATMSGREGKKGGGGLTIVTDKWYRPK
ncbi:hypothetical protein HDU87_008396 [Geranomyces variabilis]|uniref:PH domain-containing protein n=1 Tax=Geranomyces variabilis TaxID=109894 RepID=A0AAD5TIA4_9FUNG|nr:hypothetical protein HDU87_008396 [Geranomyces variabilis]